MKQISKPDWYDYAAAKWLRTYDSKIHRWSYDGSLTRKLRELLANPTPLAAIGDYCGYAGDCELQVAA